METIFTLVLMFFSVIAEAAYFAPGIVAHVATENEKTVGNTIQTNEECTKKNGQWLSGQGYAYCVLPYADAGKLCKSSRDCIGHCLMPLNAKTLDGILLKKGYGICQLNDETDDCGRPHLESGKTIFFNCD